ncbi:MAG: aldehyde dehydrogenase family protein, partial [Chloroflexi bacterium]|nr:aldehyde dehydrogenase family protein [Chloroflexota bacterium]
MTDTATRPRLKITYATLRNDNDELHAQFEQGLDRARGLLGAYHRNVVGGRERDGDGTFEKRTPIDGTVMGTFAKGTRQDVRDAIDAARRAFPEWARMPWQDRVALLRKVADLISERQMEFSALLSMEVGKNRLEALGDVEETADLIRWSCDMVERNDGFDHPMGNLGDPAVHTRSVLKPYGVWAVISPFNFPFALSGGPAGGALVAGNTVVYKPSSDAPLSGVCLAQVMHDAGLPDGVFNMVMGPGESVGAELQENEGVDGIIFTGSFEVGFGLYKEFAKAYPKPVIVEMGGKNPAIVSRKADLDEAAEGVMRAAFGFSGQKCSANSRVYV